MFRSVQLYSTSWLLVRRSHGPERKNGAMLLFFRDRNASTASHDYWTPGFAICYSEATNHLLGMAWFIMNLGMQDHGHKHLRMHNV